MRTVIVPAATLAAAAAELAEIARAYDAADREGCGVTIVRTPSGAFRGAYVDDDVPRGRIVEIGSRAVA